MNGTVRTASRALHHLGLATSFGGPLFARLALQHSAAAVKDQRERGELVNRAWRRFSWLNLASHTGVALTWLIDRRLLRRRADTLGRTLVRAKDILVIGSLASGIASIVAGQYGARREGAAHVPLVGGHGESLEEAPARPRALLRISSLSGIVNLVALAGIMGLTAALSRRSVRRGWFGRLIRRRD